MLEYVYIKLVTGEDLISHKIGETTTSLFLSKPILVNQRLTLEGKVKATASPYCGLAKANMVEVYKTACIFCTEMKEDARKYYDALAEQHYEVVDAAPEKGKNIKVDLEDSVEEPKDQSKTTKSILH